MGAAIWKEIKHEVWSNSAWHEADICAATSVGRSSQHLNNNNYQIAAAYRVSASPAKVSAIIIFKFRTFL